MFNPNLTHRKKKHFHIRKKIIGNNIRPRLSVFKSNNHFYAQLIDDIKQITIVASSTLKMINLNVKSNIFAAKQVGIDIAKKILTKKIKNIVFDRSGYLYHGKVKEFADSIRKFGIQF